MVWVRQELGTYDHTTGQQLGKTVDQLRNEYCLDRMLGLRKLKTLTLVGRGIGDRTTWDNLAAWFRANLPNVDGCPIRVVVTN